MKRKLICLAATLMVCSGALAVGTTWTHAVDNDFMNVGNWAAGLAVGDDPWIHSISMPIGDSPHLSVDTVATYGTMYIGFHSTYGGTLDIDAGGTLRLGTLKMGYTTGGDGSTASTLRLNDATSTLNAPTLEIGVGDIDAHLINHGTISATTMDVGGLTTGSGQVDLLAGDLWLGSFLSVSAGSNVDLENGRLLLAGDQTALVTALVVDDRLTGYGLGSNVRMDFGTTIAGWTTVTAVTAAPPAPLPFLETFETPGVTTGTINGQNGWVSVGGSADVQSGIVQAGSQALQIQNAEVFHDLESNGSAVWLHFQARCTGIPDTIPTVSTNTTLAFFVGTNLNLVVYSNTVPVELSVQVPTNVWTRFDVYCDYDDLYWDLSMDSVNVAAGFPLYSTNIQLASMSIGNGSSSPVYIDQIDIADTEQTAGGLPDSDTDGIPDWWEQKHFDGVTIVVADAPSLNEGLTYLQTYIAGVSPFAFDPFVVSGVPGGNGLAWDPVESRLYSVYWAPSLTNTFIWQANLPYPESEFIDSVHNDEETGFYRLKVQVQ